METRDVTKGLKASIEHFQLFFSCKVVKNPNMILDKEWCQKGDIKISIEHFHWAFPPIHANKRCHKGLKGFCRVFQPAF